MRHCSEEEEEHGAFLGTRKVPWMGMWTGAAGDFARQTLARSSRPWVRPSARLSGLFTQSFHLCPWDRGPVVRVGHRGEPPRRHFGVAGGRALRQRRGWRPRCHRALLRSHGRPRSATPAKALTAAGARIEDIPPPGSSSPGLLHAKIIGVGSQLPPLPTLVSSPPPLQGLFAPQSSARGARGDGGHACRRGGRCAVSRD